MDRQHIQVALVAIRLTVMAVVAWVVWALIWVQAARARNRVVVVVDRVIAPVQSARLAARAVMAVCA